MHRIHLDWWDRTHNGVWVKKMTDVLNPVEIVENVKGPHVLIGNLDIA